MVAPSKKEPPKPPEPYRERQQYGNVLFSFSVNGRARTRSLTLPS